MLLGRLRIRGKLALLLIAPLLGIFTLAVPVVGERIGQAADADATAVTVDLAGRVGSLVQDLQQERMLSVGYLLNVVDRNRLVLQSAQVTDDVADLRADGDLPHDIEVALDALPALTAVRATVLDRKAKPDAVMTAFSAEVTRVINSLQLRAKGDARTAAGQQVMALDALLRADEGVSVVAAQIVMIAALRDPATLSLYPPTMATLWQDVERFRYYATPEQSGLYDLVQKGADDRSTQGDFLTQFAADPFGTLANITLPQLFPAAESLVTLGRFVEKRIIADVKAEVADQQSRALTEAYGVGLICVLLVLCVVLLSVAVARAVARPLTRLTRSADDVAQVAEAELTKVADGELDSSVPVHLPAVDVRARDEIGDLARAFERVQATAARLVERQIASRRNVAQMFGHVGRRTQNLVGRQLALIDRLERQETDSGRLQHLYRLDHITSRLRRSAGSLVVLSGSRGADNHVAPLPLADVVRLALGEIEDYLRVDIKVPTDVNVSPSVIGDLVLVLAELMENATAFSPPQSRVTVTAVVSDPGIHLLVVDHGLGMSPERMAEENARLARRERLDLVPTEVLGLFVVGRLTRHHGMRVTLAPTPGGGVTAELEVHERHLAGEAGTAPQLPARARVDASTISSVVGGDGSEAPVYQPFRPDRSSAAPAVGPAPAPAGAADPRPTSPAPTAPAGPAPEWPIRQRTPELPAPDPSQPPLVPRRVSLTGNVPAFDEAALDRASRMLANGQPWNAFVPLPRVGETSTRDTAGPEPSDDETQAVLLRRVPGARLPVEPPAETSPPPPPNPAAARALIEEFEAGIRYAERQLRGGGAAVPGNGPANGTLARDKTTNEAAARPAQPLRRRQPGATLDTPAPAPERRTADQPPDANAARDLVQQFESGVARAMRQISAGLRDEEGSR